MKDEELMEQALSCFEKRARLKFLQGVQEHNPKGNKGLEKMKLSQKIHACQEEVIDLWFYLASIEEE
jgi:RAB protein geranylgeranyltransferase component A